jgi:hypothetical protein
MVRVRRTLDLMRHQKLSITAIAFEVGISDLRTIKRAFRELTDASLRDIHRNLVDGLEVNLIIPTNAEHPTTETRTRRRKDAICEGPKPT